MSLFQRPNSPFWYTEIQVRGTRVVRSTGTSDKREAARFERELRDQLKRETAASPKRAMTLSQAAGKYWLDHGKGLKWSKAVEWHLRRAVTHFGEDLMLVELSNKLVDEFVQARKAEGAGAAGVNRSLAVLRQVHRRASKKWDEPVRAIDWSEHWMAEPKERVSWITPAEAMKLLAALPLHIRLIVEWALYTGCRRAEILKLRWTDVDLERSQAHVDGKSGPRTLWLSAEARGVLERAEKVGPVVFDGTNLRKHFEAAVRACGIRDYTFHDTRHTHATWLRMAGVPLEVVQRSLGHSAITTTTRYAHVADGEIQAALRKLPNLVQEADGAVVIPLKRNTE